MISRNVSPRPVVILEMAYIQVRHAFRHSKIKTEPYFNSAMLRVLLWVFSVFLFINERYRTKCKYVVILTF